MQLSYSLVLVMGQCKGNNLKFFPWCGAAVLFESTAVALSSCTGEESTLA